MENKMRVYDGKKWEWKYSTKDDLDTVCVHCGQKVQGGLNYANSPIRIQFEGKFAHPSCDWEYQQNVNRSKASIPRSSLFAEIYSD